MIRNVLNLKEKTYYIFKQNDIYAIFQSSDDFEQPVFQGRRNYYEAYIKEIKLKNPNSKIYFYDIKKTGPIVLNQFSSYNI